MVKKILINILILLVLLFSFDIIFYYKYCAYEKRITHYIKSVFFIMPLDKYFDKLYAFEFVKDVPAGSFLSDRNTESKLKPILFMGCSFTSGSELNEEEIASVKTAELTNRPVYNRAGHGWGLSHLLYQLQRDDLKNTIPEPEFLIYTFIPDQLARVYKYKMCPEAIEFQPKYKIIGDEGNKSLKKAEPKLYHRLFFVEWLLCNLFYMIENKISTEQKEEIIKLYFNESYKAMRKYWKNTKFVILLYPQGTHDYILDLPVWKELEDKFIIINVNKLTNKEMEKYKCADGFHPSGEAWDIILYKLLDYLQIEYKKD